MNKDIMNMAKGMGAGLAAGMVVGFAGAKMTGSQCGKGKNKLSQAIHSMGDMVDKTTDFFNN